MHGASSEHDLTAEQRIAKLESELAAARDELKDARLTIDRLRERYRQVLEQLQLMQRRLFVAKAERVDTNADQLAFDKMFDEARALEKALDAAEGAGADGPAPKSRKPDGRKTRKTPPTGRRDLAKLPLPVERVELLDPELEGRAERIGFEESQRIAHRRGGAVRLVLARAVYELPADATTTEPQSDATPSEDADTAATDETTEGSRIVVTPLPKELFRRCMLAPSMIAHLLVAKYVMGVPFHRLEQQFAFEGFALDRGTMCRYAEDAGATLGAIVEAARKDALSRAFCLSTDATGVSIQPTPLDDGKRQACRKGHFFVTLADRDHVFFDFQAKHDSRAVWEMFKGFSGYIQADAHVVYDALFRGTPPKGAETDDDDEKDAKQRPPPPIEVGCWSHARRKFWEAAVCKHRVGLEGLRKIDAIFAKDRELAELPPSRRKERRDAVVRPLVDAFFAWAAEEKSKSTTRGLVSSALGYALRQEQPLRRFLDDGRLRLDDNAAEHALRPIAVGRKNWLFFGSDDHASAAANLFSLVASCKLHGLDPEAYLADVIRVMPYWPRDRYLELAPIHWARTRARLDPEEMKRPLGHVTVPPPLAAEQQGAPG